MTKSNKFPDLSDSSLMSLGFDVDFESDTVQWYANQKNGMKSYACEYTSYSPLPKQSQFNPPNISQSVLNSIENTFVNSVASNTASTAIIKNVRKSSSCGFIFESSNLSAALLETIDRDLPLVKSEVHELVESIFLQMRSADIRCTPEACKLTAKHILELYPNLSIEGVRGRPNVKLNYFNFFNIKFSLITL